MNTQTQVSADGIAEAASYKDGKRHLWLLYPIWLLFPVLSIGLALKTGLQVWLWLTPFVVFIAMPVLDLALGTNTTNAPDSVAPKLEESQYYRWIAYISVAFHYLALLAGAWFIGSHAVGWGSYLGITLSAGLISAYGIVTAHELGHKRSAAERWLAKITLATGFYGQYMTDHNRGHHKDVATPEDSGSSRFGEGFWSFMLFRQLPHSTVIRPWALERQRLQRKGKSPWSLENEVIQPALVTFAVYTAIVALFGMTVLPYLAMVAGTSYFFLAIIDYIEHYGLLRQKLADGRYERVRPEHSWNTDHLATNIMYMHAQRHSDHHAYPTRRYQVLRSFPGLPTMPTGYPGMFWLAIIPALWRSVMDRRLLRLVDYDLNRINVDPRFRGELFAKYSKVMDRSVAAEARSDEKSACGSGGFEASAADDKPADRSFSEYRCPGCGYIYSESRGDLSQGFAKGTRWSSIPHDWACPDCAVRDKTDFCRVTERAA